ncbi:protocadherin gamma-C5-like isoform X1 [Mya arenaria]|uniref:protocadherin gamma-C5-like isoform X1 n=1 Tax=Mya arenaria TaxID=6604 RepID=UPI0022E05391|nr:protocadherin gamma-C5-like isoform X1 [Mya arenaria]XP_052794119.1 protocadherin gamma-C5-like isoform X1 [Mya arenaria]XP_052794120.1 protocadherin gamma-C5-like isoform X1 [Mya arenaria]XP_052794121.1 protocadherin gamma-C5-like isoform X1 [Mya arenaria]XP_052794123.1 protocadherin gamma-C5-like isoform X1 [Mya arenaria]XP_052794124.1 protocadherin gamma-C5-like isoform X1 [Mya arenaria]
MEFKNIWAYFAFTFYLSITSAESISVNFEAEEEINGQQYLGNLITKVNDSVGNDLDGYGFQIPNGVYSGYFTVNESGDFSAVQKIDRESICSAPKCVLQLNVYAISQADFLTIEVNVEIMDTNDKIPEFSSNVFRLSIQEGNALGSTYELPSAVDLDTGINRIKNFVLEPNDGSFSLENHTNLDASIGLNLRINLTLDRETIDLYQLLVKAIDGGSPALTGTLTVNINITDINDNRPVFDPQKYNVTIDEDVAVNTELVIVTATDRDIGENARLSYSFTKMEPQSIQNVIAIEEATGKIFINQRINSQTGPFTLFVEAADHGNPVKRSYQAEVIINVRDINNNAPQIVTITYINNRKIREDVAEGFLVAIFDVRDADTGENGDVTCTSENENFSIRKGEKNSMNIFQFSIHVHSKLDREVKSSHDILINCSDNGEIPLHSNTSFTVAVEDVNDNAPFFAQREYSKDIFENVTSGAVLLKVVATDRDDGPNARLNYSIVPTNAMSMFYIEADGIIRAVRPFDREEKDYYQFNVIAKDNGNPSLNDTTVVEVRVLDINDNSPKFTGDSYAMAVLENSNVSTSIGQVTATDEDLGENGQVSFVIPYEFPEDLFPFHVLDDGTVITKEVLDREVKSLYKFEILASDHGNPPKSTRVPVMVTVRDVNDNKPYIEIPGDNENNSISIPHNTAKNTVIYTVVATDADENQEDELQYSIIAGNSKELFQIDLVKGEIFLTREVKDDDPKQFTLEISVKDSQEFPLESTAELHISVFIAKGVMGPETSAASTGQNILIAIIISCVTVILSIIIITIICVLKRKDNQKALYNAKAYDEQKIISDPSRSSNRSNSSRGSRDKMLFPPEPVYPGEMMFIENGFGKKQVSFSVDEEQDTGISIEASGQFDPVTSFKSPSPVPVQSPDYQNYQKEVSPPRSEKSDDTKQREIHRMTSLRVHQALIQSHNNNNNNNSKQWPQSSQEELSGQGRGYIGLARGKGHHLDDTHSESSGETTTSDSGRGGSEEDIRNITISHDTDESRSPNTSTAHPFYSTDAQSPTFTSFHGNSVHKAGPVLSAFLKKKQNRRNSNSEDKNNHNSYAMNDLSNPQRGGVPSVYSYRPNDGGESPRVNNTFNFDPHYGPSMTTFGHLKNNLDANPLLHSSKQSNLNPANSFENDSVTGRSQDDDNTTTTSGSYTINDIQDDILASDMPQDMFYKPDTFV